MENKKISLDTKIKDVLSYNKEGYNLVFSSEPGSFLELDKKTIDDLSKKNRDNYWMSFGLNRAEKESLKVPPTEALKIKPRFAMASTRLDVKYPEGFRKKWHPCWKRPDELQMAQAEGYTFVTSKDGVECFGNSPGKDIYTVGVGGEEELVLMKIPIAQYEARIKYVEEKSRRRSGAAENTAENNLKRSGGQPFKPGSKSSAKWS